MISRRQAILGTCSAAVGAGAATPAMASCMEPTLWNSTKSYFRYHFSYRPRFREFETRFFEDLPNLSKKEILPYFRDTIFIGGGLGQPMIRRHDGRDEGVSSEMIADRFVEFFSNFKLFSIKARELSRRYGNPIDDALYELSYVFVPKQKALGSSPLDCLERPWIMYASILSSGDWQGTYVPTRIKRLEFF